MMRNVWLAVAFVGTLAVGLLVGLLVGVVGGGGGEQGSASPPRTVTVERTIPARTTSNPTTTNTPTKSVASLADARSAFEQAVQGYGNPNLEVAEVMKFANNYYAEVRRRTP